MTATCPICGKQARWGKYCSRVCAGKLGGRPTHKDQSLYHCDKEAKMLKSGYLFYTWSMLDDEERELMKGGSRTVLVHRLVMAKYLGHSIGSAVVMHINGNKSDNRIENLMVGNPRENTQQHMQALQEAARWKSFCVVLLSLLHKGV